MATYIILIFLFTMLIIILQILNLIATIFLIFIVKGILRYKEKPIESNLDCGTKTFKGLSQYYGAKEKSYCKTK